MLFRMILYVMVGFFIYRVVQFISRVISAGKRDEEGTTPSRPEPHIPDYRDIKDADFIDITPKDKGTDAPKGS